MTSLLHCPQAAEAATASSALRMILPTSLLSVFRSSPSCLSTFLPPLMTSPTDGREQHDGRHPFWTTSGLAAPRAVRSSSFQRATCFQNVTGSQGSNDFQGSIGFQGMIGLQGIAGSRGSIGFQGVPGFQGVRRPSFLSSDWQYRGKGYPGLGSGQQCPLSKPALQMQAVPPSRVSLQIDGRFACSRPHCGDSEMRPPFRSRGGGNKPRAIDPPTVPRTFPLAPAGFQPAQVPSATIIKMIVWGSASVACSCQSAGSASITCTACCA